MNFGPISYSQFKCCPGRPYSVPDLYFTPLSYEWQQADFRPLQFSNETRFTSKTGNNCVRPGHYQYTTRIAVLAYRADNPSSHAWLQHLADDHSIDRIYLVVSNCKDSRDFIRRYKFNWAVRCKVNRPYQWSKGLDRDGLALFANRWLQGSLTTLFPIDKK